MRTKISAALVGLLVGLAVSVPAHADAIRLDDGTVLRGALIEGVEQVEVIHADGTRTRVPAARIVDRRASARPDTVSPDGRLIRRALDLDLASLRIGTPEDETLQVAGEEICSPWSFEAGAAFSLSQGNSEILDLRLDGLVKYERGPWALESGIIYVYGETQGSQSAESIHGHMRIEREISQRLYVFGSLLYDRDLFADLKHRWTTIGGLGFVLADNGRARLTAELGGGYTFERRFSTGVWTNDPSGYFGLDYEFENPKTGQKLVLAYDFLPNFGDFDLSQMVFEARFDQPVCAEIALSIALRVDHVLEPPVGIDATDILLTVGLRAKW
jgi:putative salt-induced outer membrane protein YdiY